MLNKVIIFKLSAIKINSVIINVVLSPDDYLQIEQGEYNKYTL